MKRFKVMGLCLVAVFALSALVASAASAALPEYATCSKAEPKNTGNYTGNDCEPATKVAGTGKYEVVLGIAKAKKTAIKGKNVGTPKNVLVSPVHCSTGKLVLGSCSGTFEPGKEKPASEAGVTECLKEKLTGTVTSAKNTKWKTVYKKCKGEGQPANTTGKKSEEIETDELESTLVYVDAGKTKAGLRVKGLGPGGRLAQYEIKSLGINIEVFGEVVAENNGNFNVAAKTTTAVVGHGPLELQKTLYVEEQFTEEQGKEFYETALALEKCEKGESPFPPGTRTQAECEAPPFNVKFKETQPVMLISVISGALSAKAPAVQNGTTENKGEDLLVVG